ncbi:ALP1-like protein isoform X1 [Tanacetum coccineum]
MEVNSSFTGDMSPGKLMATSPISIDCTKWLWAQCPQAYRAQFSRGDSESKQFILLEAVASQDLWIWHAFFGVAEWVVLMKSISQPRSNDVKQIRYKQVHEIARKDVERAFGVLAKRKTWANFFVKTLHGLGS